MDVYIKNKRIRLDPRNSIGKGGEADVFDIGNDKAAKIFKPANHPDYQGAPQEQQAASARLVEHQKKLKNFPRNLPSRVVVPEELITNQDGKKVVGYTMMHLKKMEALLKYSERTFRQAGISNERVVEIYQDLFKTVNELHEKKVVIGDFNDLNVLVKEKEAYLIDADSFQFDQFLCKMFTAKFVDPLLCDPKKDSLMLFKPHTAESDWYAFAVMLMQGLLFVDPYGGIYQPKDRSKKIPHGKRPLKRITVFNPEVRYPKPAIPFSVLPDDLLQHFHQVFEKDQRGKFPINILNNLRWTKCVSCGTEHARGLCPNCAQTAPAAIKEVTIIRGKVIATQMFRTSGIIIFADFQKGNLRWLYHEGGEFKREDKTTVVKGELDTQMRFRIRDKETLIGKDGRLISIVADKKPNQFAVDSYGTLPVFDANENHQYWLQNGQLIRNDYLGQKYIGDVLANQTLFWVGPEFGFGFYRAGQLSVAFVFDALKQGINDSVKLPSMRGQLIDATCVFSKDRAWFFTATQEGGRIINQCAVITRDGKIEATAQAEKGNGTWLSNLRGKCAAGNFLLVATDDGIVRVEPDNGQIVKVKEFPDTEPFVDAECQLFSGKEGLYVVNRKDIKILKMR